MKKIFLSTILVLLSILCYSAPKLISFTIDEIAVEDGHFSHAGHRVIRVESTAYFKSKTDVPQITEMRYEFTDKASGKVIYRRTIEQNKRARMGGKSVDWHFRVECVTTDVIRDLNDHDLECRVFVMRGDKEIGCSEPYSFRYIAHVAEPGEVSYLYGPAHLGIVFKGFTGRDGSKLCYAAEVYYDDMTPVQLKDEIESYSDYGNRDCNVVAIPRFYKKGKDYSMDTEQMFYCRPLVTDRSGNVMWKGELTPVCFKSSTVTYSEPRIRISGDHLVITTDRVHATNYYTGKARRVEMYGYLRDKNTKLPLEVEVNGQKRELYGASGYFTTTNPYSDSFYFPGEVEVKFPLDRVLALGVDNLSCPYYLSLSVDARQYSFSHGKSTHILSLDNLNALAATREREKEAAALAAAAARQRQQQARDAEAQKLLNQLEEEAGKISTCCDAIRRTVSNQELVTQWAFVTVSEGEKEDAVLALNFFNPVYHREISYKRIREISRQFNKCRSKGSISSGIENKFNSVYKRAEREYRDNVSREMSILKSMGYSIE